MLGTGNAPVDWYLSSFAANISSLYWEEGAEEKVELARAILGMETWEVVLDLCCATGGRTHRLHRLGFDVVGADPRAELLEVAGGQAQIDDLEIGYFEVDPRKMDFHGQFDVVLSLGGGAFEHYPDDQDCFDAFKAAARALRPGGRLLMQIPNVLHIERHLPSRTWVRSPYATELIDQRWNAPARRLDGTRRSLIDCESPEEMEPFDFQRRLYTIAELAEIFDRIGLRLIEAYDENGAHWEVDDDEQQIFVVARR